MSDATPNAILEAILNLHAFTESSLKTLDMKIGSLEARLDAKIDSLRYDMNKRFDRVDERFDRLEMRVGRLEHNRL
jgi:hypothetical protein